ncbi:glycosyltransferase [Mesorhizobium japonicum]|uniref:glycosyltransferase n=1 Tax=Mesorhizobium japonicum TaxID=2066070 RepID=UPI003B5C8B52
MTRIAIDARRGPASGVRTFVDSLVGALGEARADWSLLLMNDAPGALLRDEESFAHELRAADVDAYIGVQYWSPVAPLDVPQLRVVHDVYVLLEDARIPTSGELRRRLGPSTVLDGMPSDQTPGRPIYQLLFSRGIESAGRIAVPSATTLRELVSHFPGSVDRARVTPFAVPSMVGASRWSPPSTGFRLLNVGNGEPRRRQLPLLALCRELWLGGLIDTLTMVGSPEFGFGEYRDRLKYAQEKGREEGWLVVHTEISPSQLMDLYATSSALVVSSEHEGFCYPALEAMATGLPVIGPRGGAVDDLCGDLLFGYQRFAEIAEAVVGVRETPRSRLINTAPERIRMARQRTRIAMGDAFAREIESMITDEAERPRGRDHTGSAASAAIAATSSGPRSNSSAPSSGPATGIAVTRGLP